MRTHYSTQAQRFLTSTQSTLTLSCFLFSALISQAQICQNWSKPQTLGLLDIKLINESSGMIQSQKFSDRLYHHNDSGGGAYFFKTDLKGQNTQKIKIQNHTATDIEDISIGPCENESESCLYIADMGDNNEVRQNIQMVMIHESERFSSTINADRIIYLKYPDKAHNAEAMFLNSSGNLFILTKEYTNQKSSPSKVFKINREKLLTASSSKSPHVLELIGTLDIPKINKEFTPKGQIITAADIQSHDESFVVLTYENAIEFNLNLEKTIPSTEQLVEGQDYQKIRFNKFVQQEAIAYNRTQNSVMITTESVKKSKAPLIQIDCLD